MAKPLFHDIVPPDKKSIKKIPIPERQHERRTVSERPEKIHRDQPEPQYQPPTPRPAPSPRLKRRKAPIVLVIVALILIGLIIYIFIPRATSATISLIPRGQSVTVSATFSASKDANALLPYQVAIYEKDGKLTVPASGSEFAETKASGVIRIFNNYSAAPQKLVMNTRFQTPQGLIFRISQPVTVPGKSGSTPGSADVAVTAEKVGADYNVGLTDFTIPGFKGDPRFTSINAHSASAIGGGFSGNRKKVGSSDVTAARQKIRDELEASLIRQMQQNIPENFVFLPSAYFVEYESLPDTDVETGVQLTERATFHGIMFKRADLAQAILAKMSAPNAGQNDLTTADTLAFSVKSSTTTKPWDSQNLTFTLNGTTTLISSIDADKLKDELAGKPRKSLSAVLAGYPGVAKAQVIIRPFWQQSFPDDKSEITIDIAKTPSQE
jgi:hypothetical protein